MADGLPVKFFVIVGKEAGRKSDNAIAAAVHSLAVESPVEEEIRTATESDAQSRIRRRLRSWLGLPPLEIRLFDWLDGIRRILRRGENEFDSTLFVVVLDDLALGINETGPVDGDAFLELLAPWKRLLFACDVGMAMVAFVTATSSDLIGSVPIRNGIDRVVHRDAWLNGESLRETVNDMFRESVARKRVIRSHRLDSKWAVVIELLKFLLLPLLLGIIGGLASGMGEAMYNTSVGK